MIRTSDTIAVAALVIGLSCSFNSHAGMRCGNELILEGDPVVKMYQVCGEPQQGGMNIIYLNKDKDGMNYYIHADSNGIIDDIQSSRGGLR